MDLGADGTIKPLPMWMLAWVPKTQSPVLGVPIADDRALFRGRMMAEEPPLQCLYRRGQVLSWAPKRARRERIAVKVIELTDKRVVVNVIEPGWDHSRKYYLREAWLLPRKTQ